MNKKIQSNPWNIKPIGQVRSVDISAVVYKTVRKENPYNRSASYRNRKSISLIGSNSEVY